MSLDLLPCAVTGADSAILQNIGRDNCNLAIWERGKIPDYAPLIADTAEPIRIECAPCDLGTALRQALSHNGFDAPHLHAPFTSDVALLAQSFCTTLAVSRLEVRLEVVTTDSCRKFHADYVSARLITTYVGPGTEWLDAKSADQVAKGAEPLRINRMNAGDVGIFKGKMATLHPAIHRSPPIATSGEKRLLLVLNPIEARRG
jgi:hypothetical protein